jgi:sugar phosphate isomerase/epimerase
LLTTEEMTESMERQLKSAKDLGFSIVRIQIGANDDVIRAVTPTAEKYGLKLGMELHAPEGPNTEKILKVRALYDEIGSPNLGFIPDFSSTMHSVPPGYLADQVENGLPQEFADLLVAEWAGEGAPFERFGRFAAAAKAAGVAQENIDACMMAFTMFGREPIEDWPELTGRVFHVHGKCYGFDENGDEPSIDYRGIVRILQSMNFDGFISSEWEGHVFRGPEQADSFAEVAKHQALIRSALGK